MLIQESTRKPNNGVYNNQNIKVEDEDEKPFTTALADPSKLKRRRDDEREAANNKRGKGLVSGTSTDQRVIFTQHNNQATKSIFTRRVAVPSKVDLSEQTVS